MNDKKAASRSCSYGDAKKAHDPDRNSIARAELLGGLAFAIGTGACMLHWAVML